jgi:Ca2+-binding EF-hand superfamily protein
MRMARMADTNSDGAITTAEFTAAALQRFDAMDTNKDGQVTPEERQAAREQMRAKWQQMRAQRSQS